MTRERWTRPILCLPLLLAVPAICLAQSGGKSKQQQQEPTRIHVVSRLVNVSVVVQNKDGRPVTRLSQKDFTIYDDGHEQAIAFFRGPVGSVAPSASSPLPPDVYSNAGTNGGGATAGVTIILLDGLNTGLIDQAGARAQVIRFLKQIQPNDRVALYTLGKKLSIIHDFTGSTATLIAAVNRYEIRQASTVQEEQETKLQKLPERLGGQDRPADERLPGDVASLNEFIEMANQISQAFAKNNRLGITISALRAIALHVAGVPGRKNLIWVAGNLPYCLCQRDKNINPDFYYKNVLGTEQFLSSVNLAVYPVDARGLYGPSLHTIASGGGGTVAPSVMRTPPWGRRAPSYPPHFAMEDAAKQTGGFAFFNTNDIMGAIRRAVSDADSSYLLSYYPNHKDWKGEFRKIKVKVDQPGLTVRTRSGYYATPAPYGQLKDSRAAIVQIVTSPVNATGIRFAVRVMPRESNGSQKVELILKFDPHGLQFTAEKKDEMASLQYGFVQMNKQGRTIDAKQESTKVVVSEAAYRKAMQEGMGFSVLLSLQKKASTLIVFLRDARTGVAGSVRIPLGKYQAAQ